MISAKYIYLSFSLLYTHRLSLKQIIQFNQSNPGYFSGSEVFSSLQNPTERSESSITMATGFREDEDRCEGLGCHAASGVAYYVEEKRNLCEHCATKTGCRRKVRKNELGLFCTKHDKPVRLHCKHHDLAVCHLCATINHTGPPCKLQDVENAIAVKKCELNNLQKTSKDKVSSWKKFGERLDMCTVKAEEELQSIKECVNSVIDDKISKITTKEQNEILGINQEADAEIKTINEKRKARLDKCHVDAEKYRQPIESRRRELLDDVTAITGKIKTKMVGLQRDARDVIKAMDEAAERIRIFLEDDKKLLEGAQELVTSLTDTLGKTADERVVEHIAHTVNGVRFIEGVGHDKYNGIIGGFEGTWELSLTVEIPSDIKKPYIVGCTSNDDIIISDARGDKFHTYCSNVRNIKSYRRVITSDGKTYITSCALLDEDTVVCGKYTEGCTGDSLTGCISMYDINWQLIRDITIPRNTSSDYTWVYVAVDRDGMIIAAELWQRYIYVVNPRDGSIVNTIKCKENIGRLRGVMSTRDVIAHPFPWSNKLLIIDRQGAQREITHSEKIRNCIIDPLTDDLYVVYWDEGREQAVIDQLSGECHQERVEVASFDVQLGVIPGPAFVYNSRPVMTSSGQLIVSNSMECLMFKKSFSV